MSMCLTPYMVNLATIANLPASPSGDIDKLIERLRSRVEAEYSGDADEIAQAIRDIAAGQVDGGDGYVFGFALKYLCAHYGVRLSNDWFCPTSVSAIEALDVEVRAAGVTQVLPLSFVDWKPPLALPEAPDLCIATFDRQACRAAAAQYSAAIPALAESEHRSEAIHITRWLRECGHRNQDLFVFMQ